MKQTTISTDCLCLCVFVSLFIIHSLIFHQISTKFGMWHPTPQGWSWMVNIWAPFGIYFDCHLFSDINKLHVRSILGSLMTTLLQSYSWVCR